MASKQGPHFYINHMWKLIIYFNLWKMYMFLSIYSLWHMIHFGQSFKYHIPILEGDNKGVNMSFSFHQGSWWTRIWWVAAGWSFPPKPGPSAPQTCKLAASWRWVRGKGTPKTLNYEQPDRIGRELVDIFRWTLRTKIPVLSFSSFTLLSSLKFSPVTQ